MTVQAEIKTGALSELDALSAANIASIGEQYADQAVRVGQFPHAEAAARALAESSEAVGRDNRLTINMTADSLNHFLAGGRLGTYWDAQAAGVATEHVNKKAVHERYTPMRQAADAALGRYAPPDAVRADPLYAAVAGPADADTGAAPQYGNYWLELSEAVAGRAVYNLSDSHASLRLNDDDSYAFDESMILNRQDAVAGKAVTELIGRYQRSLRVGWMGNLMVFKAGEPRSAMLTVNGQSPGYVEAAVFDEVTASEVVAMHAAVNDPKSMYELGRLMRRHPAAASGITVHDRGAVSPFASDWLRRPAGGQPAELSSGLWERLGIDPSASAEDITQALSRAASLKLRDISRATHRLVEPGLPDMQKVSDNWHNYTLGLRERVRYGKEADKQLMEDFIELQRARLFFCDDPDQA